MRTVISVEKLSKYYRLGLIGGGTLSSDLNRWWARWRGKPDPLLKIGEADYGNREGEYVWALREVSFEVQEGEILGIIGRNGAGKSTLLKILSRVTAPTSGQVKVKGRVGSLLEVGTGFHPELTGRENVYLNGAILGMRRAEIDRQFDEIVEFSGVEKFIDTPVKRYSSGMYVRLGFAVAAHLDPEILVVDEVLAVGDASFQKKCLGKMKDVSQSGRTVLFVSHNMATMARLCERIILLDSGKLVKDGSSESVIATYLQSGLSTSAKREWPNLAEAPGNEFVRVRSVRVVNKQLLCSEIFDIREMVGIEISFDIIDQKLKFVPMIALFNGEGVLAFNAMDTAPAWRKPQKAGRYTSRAWIPSNLLSEGMMSVTVLLSTHSSRTAIKQAYIHDAVAFQVTDPIEGDSARGDYVGSWGGSVRPLLCWQTEYIELENEL